jgi:hypothetical protein
VFQITSFDEPKVISRRLMHIDYGVHAKTGSDHRPRVANGRSTPLITISQPPID